MKRDEMYELAKIGLRVTLKAQEADLLEKYHEFPDLFTGPPQFLRPELRNGSSPHGAHDATVITALPTGKPGSAVAKMLPYLQKHGPTHVNALAKGIGLKGAGSMASSILRHVRAGTITRVSPATYDITAAGRAAISAKGKGKPKPPPNKNSERRAVTAQMLALFANEPQDGTAVLRANGFNIRALGPLVHRGYLTKLRSGLYHRTGKAFVVDTRKSAG